MSVTTPTAGLTPWTKREVVYATDHDVTGLLVALNGQLVGLVKEAKSGTDGYVTRYDTTNGDFADKSPTITESGLVEFFEMPIPQ